MYIHATVHMLLGAKVNFPVYSCIEVRMSVVLGEFPKCEA
jgi:hypothetical protein